MLGRASIYASLGVSAWLAGYIYGYLVAEREGVDSDPEDSVVVATHVAPLVQRNYG